MLYNAGDAKKEISLKSISKETKQSPETLEDIALSKLNLYPNAEKICPTCGLPMFKKPNLIGVMWWRCQSDNRNHSVPFED